jgi:hypothetical protein
MTKEQVCNLLVQCAPCGNPGFDDISNTDWEELGQYFKTPIPELLRLLLSAVRTVNLYLPFLSPRAGDRYDYIVDVHKAALDFGVLRSGFIPFYDVGNGDLIAVDAIGNDFPVYYVSSDGMQLIKMSESLKDWTLKIKDHVGIQNFGCRDFHLTKDQVEWEI